MAGVSVDRIRGLTGGLPLKAPCRAATTGNITLSGEQTVDGIALVENDRCFVRAQTDNKTNGIYDVQEGTWKRSPDFNNGYEVTYGTEIFVQYGTTLHDKFYIITCTDDPVVFGTSAITSTVAPSVEEAVAASNQATIDAAAAAASALAAGVSETSAGLSASNASDSAIAAAASAVGVSDYADAASASAIAAAASESAAGGSATAAGTSETNAGLSAAAAAISETNAGTSETNAGTSETNANNSAIAAAASESAAAGSETNAGTSASEAADYAASALACAVWRTVYGLTSADSPYAPAATEASALYAGETDAGNVVVNLPEISGLALPYTLGFKLKSGTNDYTINCTGTDTFDNGTTTYTFEAVGDSIHLVADDATTPMVWYMIVFGSTTPTGATATAMTVANEATDTTCFPVFVTAATGDLGPKSNAGLAFNSNTGILSATGFAGPLTGNVTGNVSGSAGSCTGNADSADVAAAATTVITENEATDTTCFPLFALGQTGNYGPKTNASFTFDSGTCTLAATTFSGAFSGNATTASGLSATLVPSKGGTGVANNDAATITRTGDYAFTLTLAGEAGISLASGKTPVFNNSITFNGTDATTMYFPPFNASVGYLTLPQQSESTAYTTVANDSGKHILHPTADTTARIYTIPSNANVAYPVGTVLTFINQHDAGTVTIAITTDTMYLAGAGTTGSRTLAANGIATAIKVATTEWLISGTGLT